MPEFDDSGHRPHAVHEGEDPQLRFSPGPNALKVTLDAWGPQPWNDLVYALYNEMQANWGDRPSQLVSGINADAFPHVLSVVENLFAGKTLPQPLELLSFAFTIDGCSRATTHQLVRTRIGAGFMQHGGRDNDWRHRDWTFPETIRRACFPKETAAQGLDHCVVDWSPIEKLVGTSPGSQGLGLHRKLAEHLLEGKKLYAALVDAGIPWQDARRVLTMGTQTYLHANYTYPTLQGVLANRLEHVMDWEINCVAQLMLRQIKIWCPPLLSKYLGSHSDRQGKAAFAGLESWPPDGKYPNPLERCKTCGHGPLAHPGLMGCAECHNNGEECTTYVAQDMRLRTHRPAQNPFWVLHPDSMNGGPVEWIPTNGVFPEKARTK